MDANKTLAQKTQEAHILSLQTDELRAQTVKMASESGELRDLKESVKNLQTANARMAKELVS